MNSPHRDDRELGRLLRAGDPAGDGRDPDQAELQAWRRQTLTAAADNTGAAWFRTRRLALPVLATAAAVVLAVLFLRPAAGPGPAAPGSQIAATAPVPGIPETVAITPDAAVIPAAVSRTLQFTAPGGTRIIWTLNPDLQLDPHGGSS